MADSSPTLTAPALSPQPAAAVVYKGKFTRSWPQLPDELVRHIATFYLLDASVSSYCPQVWDTRELWHHRMLYTSVRDGLLLEKNLMSICVQWSKALETHIFWHHAIALIDPLDCLAHNAIVHPSKPPPASETCPSSTTDTQKQDQPSSRLTPYCHYRNILTYSCLVCRVNQPNSSVGLTLAKRLAPSPLLGPISLCREHDRRRNAFCGICMREAPLFEGNAIPPSYAVAGINPNTALAAQAYNTMSVESIVSCLENEDEDTWPGVTATCRFCRREWLWRKVAGNTRDREAIGGSKLASEDWETRQCVEGFIDLAEGTINDVIGLAREKWWLRKYTRLGDMMLQALAAARFTSANAAVAAAGGRRHIGEGVYSTDIEEEEEEEEDDEEDPELMQLTEEGGVRELALGDWARSRILDGHWFSPADLWYRNSVPGKPTAVSAVHPCPWAREDLGQDAEDHPRSSTVNAEIPPSYALCEQAYVAHQRQMRVVLLPAMKNVVRRLVIECIEDAKYLSKGECTWGGSSDDPAMRASKIGLEDLLRILREEEGVWFDGVDWAERRRNNAQDHMITDEKKESDQKASEMSTDSPISTTGSGSSTTSGSKSGASSGATSPVLSTSTLQTTPSPPPVSSSSPSLDATPREGDGDCLDDLSISGSNILTKPAAPPLPPRSSTRLITIAISPILNPPRMLRPIPHVPITLSHLPHYSLEAFRAVWREACAPLYHCRCKICERAMAKANADAAANAQANGSLPVSSQAQETRSSPQLPDQGLKKPIEIRLDVATEADGEGEEEVEHSRHGEDEEVEYEGYEEEEEEEIEISSTFGEHGEDRGSYSPSTFSRAGSPDAILDGEDDPENDAPECHFRRRRSRAGSNSDEEYSSPPLHRSRKRSCDELEDEGAQDGSSTTRGLGRQKEGTPPKRPRKGNGGMDPRPAAALAIGGRTRRMRKRNSEELEHDDDDDSLGDRAAKTERRRRTKTGVARGSRGNASSSERSEDTTGPHKRLKISGTARDYRDGTKRSRGSRVSAPFLSARTMADRDVGV